MTRFRSTLGLTIRACLLLGLATAAVAQQQASGFRALSGQQAASFAMPSDMRLVKTIYLSKFDLTYERYQQFHGPANAQVLGAQITLYRNSAGVVTTIIGAHYPNLRPANAVGLDQAAAASIAAREVGPGAERTVGLFLDPQSSRYFYRVETKSFDSRWVHWVDGGNGQVVNRYDALTTGSGSGVKGDAKTWAPNTVTTYHGSSGHGASSPHWDLSSNTRQITYDARNRSSLLYFVTDDDDNWNVAGTTSPGHPALIDAQYYARVTDDFYTNALGFTPENWENCFPGGQQSVAHYSRKYNNAFWNGTYMVYGDGDGSVFRELSGGLDVAAHEFSHGVTECFSNLIYQDEPGALNEAFSDMLGSSAEFHAASANLDTAPADWYIGEDVYLPSDTAPGFRNMSDPAEDGDPDHYSERQIGGTDNGGVHSNSGIPNHAYYLLVNGGINAGCVSPNNHSHCTGSETPVGGIVLSDAEDIFFLGFQALSSNATMADARVATEATGTSLFGAASTQLASVSAAWEAVGVGAAAPPPPPGPPTVSITSPADGTTVSGTVTVTADASADAGVVQVEFFVDGASIGVDTSEPYSASWVTTGLSDGSSHTITAVVTDSASPSQQATSEGVTVTVDNSTPPPSSISLSASGYKVKGLQKADLTWSGATSTNVDVYRNGDPLGPTLNDGFYTDEINNRGGGSYTYQVCESDSTTCSNEATVVF